jgi:hypothetical protein
MQCGYSEERKAVVHRTRKEMHVVYGRFLPLYGNENEVLNLSSHDEK